MCFLGPEGLVSGKMKPSSSKSVFQPGVSQTAPTGGLHDLSYRWLVGNGGMGYNYNYYYYHSSIPY